MIPVNAFLPGAVAEIIRKAPMSQEKVEFAWRTAVGPSVDRVTKVRLTGYILQVHASDAAWRREIEHSAALIRNRLESLLGPGIVRGLNVTID
jgi:hypothetical protein